MTNSIRNNIYKKIKLPPCGFILQKDIYTTNLLYANNQFPLTSLKQRLPFRPKSGKKIENPNDSILILRKNGNISQNSDQKFKFYSLNNFKPKNLIKKKLKFPLIRLKAFPLTSLNLYENISKKDVKVKNIDDDLNITSNKGKRIYFRFKKEKEIKKISNLKKFKLPSIFSSQFNSNNSRYNIFFKHRKKGQNDKSMDKFSSSHIIDDLNKELINIKKNEINRKKSFIRDKFFSTQIYIENIMDLSNGENNKKNIYDLNYY